MTEKAQATNPNGIFPYVSDIDVETEFPSFIINESLDETRMANLSPFLTEKIILDFLNQLVVSNKKKPVNNILNKILPQFKMVFTFEKEFLKTENSCWLHQRK